MKKMNKGDISRGNKNDMSSHGGNKVLPLSSADVTLSRTVDEAGTVCEKKDMAKGDTYNKAKAKAMSRMKELLRWAAAAKSEKGGKFITSKVLRFKNRGTLRAVPDDDQLCIESPKISFRWEVESCSTTSSVYSSLSITSSLKNDKTMSSLNSISIQDLDKCPAKKGNWITTDSEFVVLEL